ncbi:ABC transporter permease [Ramlibacter solisilvae]|uniref:ABC transporter permease n=1 Tax=Ramlibacter tataouinensis TaxID=94132 RepID=A0A127JZS9_9BURK|nr:ABC transporter permease [Ramlibacter tataouinensis]AMO23642.1 ABC transporter permease [Ramlibacter tataouinensis]
MGNFLIARLSQTALMLAAMSMLVFVGIYLIGDPTAIFIQPNMSPEDIEHTRRALGFDKPLWQQYWLFASAALHGDLGTSFSYNRPALEVILERLPATFELATVAMFVALVLGVPLGLMAGLRPQALTTRAVMGFSVIGFSVPGFFVALMLVVIFSIELGWLPATGRGQTVALLGVPMSVFTAEGWRHLALPAITLALYPLSLVIRVVRAGTAENLRLDYVRFARAKGVAGHRIVLVHVLKNIAIPLITIGGLTFGTLLAFAVVTETIFAWPGMGKLLIDAINVLDRPLIVAYILVTVVIFAAINLVSDLLYAALDPRVRMADGQ